MTPSQPDLLPDDIGPKVFVDELFVWPSSEAQAHRVGSRHGHQWCHMWSDDVEALHAMARRLGMCREWFQNKPEFPHYDLVPTKRAKAIVLGAVEMPLGEWIRIKRGYGQSST